MADIKEESCSLFQRYDDCFCTLVACSDSLLMLRRKGKENEDQKRGDYSETRSGQGRQMVMLSRCKW